MYAVGNRMARGTCRHRQVQTSRRRSRIDDRLFLPDRLGALLANLLDESSATVRERRTHLKALRTEHRRVEGAIKDIFDFI